MRSGLRQQDWREKRVGEKDYKRVQHKLNSAGRLQHDRKSAKTCTIGWTKNSNIKKLAIADPRAMRADVPYLGRVRLKFDILLHDRASVGTTSVDWEQPLGSKCTPGPASLTGQCWRKTTRNKSTCEPAAAWGSCVAWRHCGALQLGLWCGWLYCLLLIRREDRCGCWR